MRLRSWMRRDDLYFMFGMCVLSSINIAMALMPWAFWGLWASPYAPIHPALAMFLFDYRFVALGVSLVLLAIGVFAYVYRKKHLCLIYSLILAQTILGWFAWLAPMVGRKW